MSILGEVTEWPKVHAWKACVGQPTVGSNPTLSAIFTGSDEGRVLETIPREPRQVREEATVAVSLGLWVARPSSLPVNLLQQ